MKGNIVCLCLFMLIEIGFLVRIPKVEAGREDFGILLLIRFFGRIREYNISFTNRSKVTLD